MKSFDEYKVLLGREVQSRRSELGMSLRAFGLMTGVHYNQLLHIEQGKANPSLATLYKIAGGLNVDITDLLS